MQTQNDEPTELTLEEREEQLKVKEAALVEKETELEEKKAALRFRYKLYDKINISVKTMNIVIIALVVVLLLLIAYGVYDAHY